MTKKKKKNRYCDICYLPEANNPEITFHLYKEKIWLDNEKHHICNKCLEWIAMMEETAIEQVKNPESDVFKDITFWWKPAEEDMSAIETKTKQV